MNHYYLTNLVRFGSIVQGRYGFKVFWSKYLTQVVSEFSTMNLEGLEFIRLWFTET